MTDAAKSDDMLVTMRRSDLRALVSEAVREALQGSAANAQDGPAYMTVKQAAELLQVTPLTARTWIQKGVLAAQRAGSTYRVSRAAVLELLESPPAGSHTNKRGLRRAK